jgi:serine/threonine protein kinase
VNMQVIASIQYHKIQQIGVGQGMNSEVFLASDPQLNGTVAVKEIPKSHFGNSISSYFSEAHAMFAAAHPNIVPVQYACETPNLVCLAMPYFPSGSLADRIHTDPIPLQDLQRVAQGVLGGLARIHAAGFLHLDIKPSNVLFTDADIPMVADFGQARSIGKNGFVQMPPMYCPSIPPETWVHSTATFQSDIYQVGLLLYRAVNGDGVFQLGAPAPQELRPKTIAGKFPDRSLFLPHVPKRVRTLIRKALKTDPSDRYRSAIEMADEFASLDIRLNWVTNSLGNGQIQWRAARTNQPDIVVELLAQTQQLWATRVYTAHGSSMRAKNPKDYWRKNIHRRVAEEHLKWVFEELWA